MSSERDELRPREALNAARTTRIMEQQHLSTPVLPTFIVLFLEL